MAPVVGGDIDGASTYRPEITRFQAWVLAARPKTLPAAIAPVLVGSAVAASDGGFSLLPALLALLCALLIQIGTNLANDYYDFVKGADTEQRIGPVRVVQSGLIPAATVRSAMIFVFVLTFLLGLYLVIIGGWPILAIGLASILFAILYTAGPFPLAYHGLGELFVFLFFGIIAVTGTYYVQALSWSSLALTAAVPIGAISTAILVVNNYRDIDSDRLSGKRTLAVRMGRTATVLLYRGLLVLAFLVPVLQAVYKASPVFLLPLLAAPLAWHVQRVISRNITGVVLNGALATTGQTLALFSLLYVISFLLA